MRIKEVWRESGTTAGPIFPFPPEGQQVANSQERMDSVPQKVVPLRMPLFFSGFRESSGSNGTCDCSGHQWLAMSPGLFSYR